MASIEHSLHSPRSQMQYFVVNMYLFCHMHTVSQSRANAPSHTECGTSSQLLVNIKRRLGIKLIKFIEKW